MKNFTNLITLCFVVLMITSCATRAAYLSRSERSSYSSSGSSSLAPSSLKTSASKSSIANSTLLSNSNTSSQSGFLVGIYFTGIQLSETIQLQPEVDFLIVKNLNEIQVPVLLKYNIADEFSLLAGPNFGFLLDAPTGLKSFNYGVDVGGQYNIDEKININARYGLGLVNLLENAGSSSLKLSGFQIGVGYRF